MTVRSPLPPRTDPFEGLASQGPYHAAAVMRKAMRDFEQQTGHRPTALYLGKREWPDALEFLHAFEPLLTHQAQAVGEPPEFMGIKFYRAADAAHFALY